MAAATDLVMRDASAQDDARSLKTTLPRLQPFRPLTVPSVRSE